jgi:hypothetical protein
VATAVLVLQAQSLEQLQPMLVVVAQEKEMALLSVSVVSVAVALEI